MEIKGVTVYCLVYNHEKYLRQCLDSLVHQKTSFSYNVIVHEDASTDNSAGIIQEYATLYPNIITAIYETENQYRKGGLLKRIIEPLIHAKYVAICEGDDFWTSDEKLQKQYDIMEQHPECGLCLHRTREVNEDGVFSGIEYPEQVYETGFISDMQLFDTIGHRIYHTSSYFIREELWHQYIKNPPTYYGYVGDLPILLYFGSRYKVYQFNEVMSCYRRGSKNSWSNRRFRADTKSLVNHYMSMYKIYSTFDLQNCGKYHEIFLPRISNNLYAKCTLDRSMKDLLKDENSEYYLYLSLLKKISVYVGTAFPTIMKQIYLYHLKGTIKQERNRWY